MDGCLCAGCLAVRFHVHEQEAVDFVNLIVNACYCFV